jgi:hypothetical protein
MNLGFVGDVPPEKRSQEPESRSQEGVMDRTPGGEPL